MFSFDVPVIFFSFSRRKSESETNQNDRSSTPPVHILPILHHLSIIFEKEMVGGWWVGGKETHVQRGLLAYPPSTDQLLILLSISDPPLASPTPTIGVSLLSLSVDLGNNRDGPHTLSARDPPPIIGNKRIITFLIISDSIVHKETTVCFVPP